MRDEVLDHASDEELFAALRRRGFLITPYSSPTEVKWVEVSKPPTERNTVPEERWLEVWRYLREAQTDDNTLDIAGNTWRAVVGLYELLEPPSVRERRKAEGVTQ